MLNRANTLVNVGYGEDKDLDGGQEHEQEEYIDQRSSLVNHECNSYTDLRNSYTDEKVGILNKEGRENLNRLYVNNKEFRDEIISYVKNKMQLDLEAILDRRYKTNTLNIIGKKYLTECVASKDNTKDVIEILGKYVGSV